ncbi:4868_t:CDS:2 [Racocetra fulgida]|uniref:4868_t:CDS:1 n=1 Tax=Racocetra fulgida TaxID=60492 RepID=A0A9N9AM12_9GLOM|nr:4868_t:CDS:2 [Racocetra fulgida]
MYQAANPKKSGEKSDDLDESSEAEKKISSATTRKNEQPLNKSSRKRLPSWTNRYFDTFRLEKKRKCNVLINTKEGKSKCGHSFELQTIKEVCIAVNQSMSKHWDEPKEAGLIASYLDPRFKNLRFLNVEERTETISLLRTQIIESSDSHTCTTTGSLTKNTQEHMMSKFFDDSDTVAQSSLDTELQLYDSLPLVPKYDLDHPEYKKDNPLLF